MGGRLAVLVDAAAGIGLDPVAAGAEQAIDRQLGDLAGDVPQRDVDAADRLHDEAAPAVLPGAREHLLPEIFDQLRVLANEQRREVFFDHRRGDAAADPGFADADEATVGLDLDDQRAAPRLHPAGAGIGPLAAAGQCTPPTPRHFHHRLPTPP